MPSESLREKSFTMRMSEEELQRLQAVADHHEISAAAVIRLLLKREAAKIPAKKAVRK